MNGLRTCHSSKYSWLSCKVGTHPATHYASVPMLDPTCTTMHSKVLLPSLPVSPLTFHKRLASYRNPSLCNNLSAKGNGSWLRTGVIKGSLCIGSFMSNKSTNLCLAGANLALPPPPTILHCNNRGVLSHGNNPLTSLP